MIRRHSQGKYINCNDVVALSMKKTMSSNAVLVGTLLLAIIPASAQTVRAGVPGQTGKISKQRDGIVYGISRNETLSSIAQRFTGNSNNWQAIGKLNGIANDRTIPVGTSIAIPARLLPDRSAFATIVAAQGEVSIISKDGDVVASKAGGRLGEGALIVTSDDGFITLQLQDGTTFALPPASSLQLSTLQIQEYTDRPRTALTLSKGRITSQVTPFSASKSQYEVQTPLAIAGVRGTRFRVNFDGERSYNEVLEGTVKVAPEDRRNASRNASQAREVRASFGAIAATGNKVSAPVPLPAAPVLAATAVQERLPVRFGLRQADAAAFRVSVATDAGGLQQVADVRVDANADDGTQARVADLPDGDYYVRAAAIDRSGLEGKETISRFRLKARPFAPFQQEPGAKLRGVADGQPPAVNFKWAEAGANSRYRLQIAADAGFTQLLLDKTDIATTSYTYAQDNPALSRFFWRIATIDMSSGQPDQGPWSDVKQCLVLPPQQAPAASQGQDGMNFSWSGEAGQRFVFDVSASAGFETVLLHADTSEPQASFPLPPAGVYYARLQSIETDGYRGPYSPAQRIVVERRWSTGSGGVLNAGDAPVRGN